LELLDWAYRTTTRLTAGMFDAGSVASNPNPKKQMNLIQLTRACLCCSLLPVSIFASVADDKKPASVVGVVETLNDVVNEPYRVTKSVDGDSTNDTRSVTFLVPSGKRLIIETLTLLVKAPTGEKIMGFIHTPGSDGNPMIAHVPVPSQGVFGLGVVLEHFIASQAMKVRVDGGNSVVVQAQRINPGKVTPEPFIVQATICGFLVDIAP
jgi:hypothetical protein